MINLIPPPARRDLVKEYWFRVITVWLFLLGTASLIILLLLLPTYVLIGIKINSLKSLTSIATEKSLSYDIAVSTLATANKQAQLLVNTPEIAPFTNYISSLEKLASTTIMMQELRFNRTEAKAGSIQVSGVAKTRQGLADFRDAIETNPDFLAVDLPISSLIKDRDLLFSLKITMATDTKMTNIPL